MSGELGEVLGATARTGVCPVADAEHIRQVLAGDDYSVAAYGRGYEELSDRKGYDFSNIAFALHYLPVAHDGEWHAHLRDRASKFLQERNDGLKILRQQLAQDASQVFERGGRIDLVADVVEPLVAAMVKSLSDVGVEISPSLIFDPSTSLRKRRILDDEIGRIINVLQADFPQLDEEGIGIRLIFAILANDASRGMLLASLGRLLCENPGRRLSEIDWPLQPPETGIRFIDRIAKCPVQLGAAGIASGTVVRSDFSALARAGDTATLFGAGRHVCLGRGFFWALWRDLTKALANVPSTIAKVDIGPTSNRVFAIPDYCFVEVRP